MTIGHVGKDRPLETQAHRAEQQPERGEHRQETQGHGEAEPGGPSQRHRSWDLRPGAPGHDQRDVGGQQGEGARIECGNYPEQ